MSRQRKQRASETTLTGADWRAAVRLTTKDRIVLAEIGETCERVPVVSWPWLIEQELMRPLACTCPPGVPRVADPACPVDHGQQALALRVATEGAA